MAIGNITRMHMRDSDVEPAPAGPRDKPDEGIDDLRVDHPPDSGRYFDSDT